MARPSSVIRADIAATNEELQKVLKEIEACTKLIAKLAKISSDVTYCTSNLSLVVESLELGLTDNGVPVGGEQVEERKRLEDFIARNKARVATRGMANSRQKQLDKMEILERVDLSPSK